MLTGKNKYLFSYNFKCAKGTGFGSVSADVKGKISPSHIKELIDNIKKELNYDEVVILSFSKFE